MSEKTEYPTAKKLRKAREDGQVAHSKDFTQTVLVVAIFGYMLANAEYILRTFGEMMVLPASLLGLGLGFLGVATKFKIPMGCNNCPDTLSIMSL